MTDVLTIEDLAVEFRLAEGVIRAVDGISFSIPQGKTVALVGESGSGKTVVSQTIMRILPKVARIAQGGIRFTDPDSADGTVELTALPADGEAMRMIRGGRISIIFQEPMTSLSPLHTVGNQIAEALYLHRDVDAATARERTVEMLRKVRFPEPESAIHKYPFELSGGLRQRAMIAMALICRPALLIADEPTTALDVTIQAQILKLIDDLQTELNMAVLMITHDLGVVANVADEVVVMYHGQVVEKGPVEEIFRAPGHPYLKALLNAIPRFDMKPGERLTPIREIKAEVGALLKRPKAGGNNTSKGAPILKVSHLSKTFQTRRRSLFGRRLAGEHLAVDDVSFEINRGECMGLVGESGCGKTTTSKLIMRSMRPDRGELIFHDGGDAIDVLGLANNDLFRFRRKVQFIFQDPFSSLNPRMSVYDVIAEPLVIHGVGDKEERDERIKELMTLVGLDVRFLRRYPHSFSGGQRQRIGIARALALQPELLICDEPVSALDVSVQAQVLNLLKDLQAELGLTYLFISHNLAVVDYISDKIAVMCAGRVVELAPREILFREPVHPYTKALLAAVPKADPVAKLDLGALMQGMASDPTVWPEPFRLDGINRVDMIHLGDGHYVRAQEEAGGQLV
ncbi:MAG: ABC transporter ATP-binding protein [Alphaproteobacteria bacterium]|jgi:peptide/nickel transport system ATP-binding protein|nr:ABC transporter ATP-binding protein [Alphaproteobacteria bacterium]